MEQTYTKAAIHRKPYTRSNVVTRNDRKEFWSNLIIARFLNEFTFAQLCSLDLAAKQFHVAFIDGIFWIFVFDISPFPKGLMSNLIDVMRVQGNIDFMDRMNVGPLEHTERKTDEESNDNEITR